MILAYMEHFYKTTREQWTRFENVVRIMLSFVKLQNTFGFDLSTTRQCRWKLCCTVPYPESRRTLKSSRYFSVEIFEGGTRCLLFYRIAYSCIPLFKDLLKCLPVTHPDHVSLKSALRECQSFLSEFKMIQPEQLFQV